MAGSFIKPGGRCQPRFAGCEADAGGYAAWHSPVVLFYTPVRGYMTQDTVKLVTGILTVIVIAIIILRRKAKKSKSADDEF